MPSVGRPASARGEWRHMHTTDSLLDMLYKARQQGSENMFRSEEITILREMQEFIGIHIINIDILIF